MIPLTEILLSLIAAAPLAIAAEPPEFLFKDVVIVGGGASGSYAAVRLRDDFGKSIALIEKEEILVSDCDGLVVLHHTNH